MCVENGAREERKDSTARTGKDWVCYQLHFYMVLQIFEPL